jgi:membrane-bound ClpP family serine protease
MRRSLFCSSSSASRALLHSQPGNPIVVIVGLTLLLFCARAANGASVFIARIDGAPGTSSYINQAIEHAATQDSSCLIIEIMLGGLLGSTKKQIVQSMLPSPVPVGC